MWLSINKDPDKRFFNSRSGVLRNEFNEVHLSNVFVKFKSVATNFEMLSMRIYVRNNSKLA